jgi:hypothetical protein
MRALACLALVLAATPAIAQRRPVPQRAITVAPKLLARYFVAVRPDGVLAATRVVRVKSKGAFSGKVTVVARRVTDPATVVAQATGSIGGRATLALTLPANGTGTPPYCITGEHHYQVSVWSGDAPASEALTLQVAPSSAVQACRGSRTAWFAPAGSYPGGVAPGPGPSGAPPAYQVCLDYEAKVKAQPSVFRPGEDPWPDPDPGVAVNPDLNACR